MSKYIDAEKLKAEIERRKNQTERRLDNIVPIRRKDTMDEEQLAKIELRDKVDKAYLNGVLITLSNILSLITSLQQEQPEVDLDALVDEAFDKYSSIDGYGQLSASFNRAELYSFIKKIARKED